MRYFYFALKININKKILKDTFGLPQSSINFELRIYYQKADKNKILLKFNPH